MKRIILSILVTILILSFTGCVSITMNAQGLSQPVVMNSELGPGIGYRTVDTFREKDRALWLVGLINIKDPDVRGMMIDASPTADAFTDVEIRTVFRPFDVIIAVATFGIIIPRTVVVRGNIVEYTD